MLSGNPDSFAIWCDSVDSWSTDRFSNGCIGFFIGGHFIWSSRSTLGTDISMLLSLDCMNRAFEDQKLFHLPQDEAYRELHRLAFPSIDSDAEANDFTHLVSAESLSDDGHYFFLIESEEKAKLIYGYKEKLDGILSVILSRGEFQSTVKDLASKFDAIGRNG